MDENEGQPCGHDPFEFLDSRMTFTVQLFFILFKKNPAKDNGMYRLLLSGKQVNLRSALFICLFCIGCSGAASFQESFLPGLDADAYLLPTDLLFRKDLETGSYRLPGDTPSARLFKENSLSIPLVFDGFSPRSHYYVPVPCNLREDLIPEKESDTLFLYDMSYRRRVPITVRYRNAQNCGLIVRPRMPLDMDRTYALVLLNSYIWQDRLHQPSSLGRLFDRLRKERDDTPELEAMAANFGLRARETRLVLDQLRADGIAPSRILRLGIAVVRSAGGMYGPYFAMLRRYQIEEHAEIDSVKRLGPGLYSFQIELREACSGTPCRLNPVAGPGILAPPSAGSGSKVEREVLIRFPQKPARTVMWMEDAESNPERNRVLFDMRIFSQVSEDASVALAMFLRPRGRDVNERLASIIEKNAVSRLLQSYSIEELRSCAEQRHCKLQHRPVRRPLLQLCLTDGDCAASAALDPEVSAVILPVVDDGLPGAAFENGRLPARNHILASYARDLREDILSLDMSRQMMKSKRLPYIDKKMHVTENLFNRRQYESLMEFINGSMDSR